MFEVDEAKSRRTRIKICGLTCPEDAHLALDLGADALGFNFYPRSSRFLDPATQLDWLRELPCRHRVAVVVNAGLPLIRRVLTDGWIDSVQLHGDEEEDFCAELQREGIRFAKAIRVRNASVLDRPERFHTDVFLLDAFQPDAYGGTGHRVDWSLAAAFTSTQATLGRKVILSGGLTPENVAAAVRMVRPFGVDVASGVEEPGNPRRKNEARLRDFMAAVRAAESAASD